jgi:hypothetical protein
MIERRLLAAATDRAIEFWLIGDQVFRVAGSYVLDVDGLPQSRRWECSLAHWQHYRAIYDWAPDVAPASDDTIASVEAWYDRHTRSWVIQRRNAAGDQLADADYVGTKAGMIQVRDIRRKEIGTTV